MCPRFISRFSFVPFAVATFFAASSTACSAGPEGSDDSTSSTSSAQVGARDDDAGLVCGPNEHVCSYGTSQYCLWRGAQCMTPSTDSDAGDPPKNVVVVPPLGVHVVHLKDGGAVDPAAFATQGSGACCFNCAWDTTSHASTCEFCEPCPGVPERQPLQQ
jgi:hypothetical protein